MSAVSLSWSQSLVSGCDVSGEATLLSGASVHSIHLQSLCSLWSCKLFSRCRNVLNSCTAAHVWRDSSSHWEKRSKLQTDSSQHAPGRLASERSDLTSSVSQANNIQYWLKEFCFRRHFSCVYAPFDGFSLHLLQCIMELPPLWKKKKN